MKKLFFVLGLLIFVSVFYACDMEDDVTKNIDRFTFLVDDSSLKSELLIVPDYEIGTLDVEFKQEFVEDTEDSEEDKKNQVYETEGIVGGDYYEDFRKLVEILEKQEMLDVKPESVKYIELLIDDQEMYMDMDSIVNEEDQKFVSDYYKEIVELFTEDLL